MSKLVVAQYVSLDGVVQGPGHPGEDTAGGFDRGGWTGPFMEDHRRINDRFFQTAGSFLMGRQTYEIFASYWPDVDTETDEIARALNERPKYVVSRTLSEPSWKGTTVLSSAGAAEIAPLKEHPGRPIVVVGSAGLIQTLLKEELVDEFQIWIHPLVVGRGKRLFRGGPPASLRFVESTTTPAGLVIATYTCDR